MCKNCNFVAFSCHFDSKNIGFMADEAQKTYDVFVIQMKYVTFAG